MASNSATLPIPDSLSGYVARNAHWEVRAVRPWPQGHSFGTNVAGPVWWLRRLLAIAADSKLGVEYWRAAERDEKNGFPFAAAMEWRKAADLFGPIPAVSAHCWREWERIMHLPRRFANPIAESDKLALQYSPAPITHRIAFAIPTEISLASAAYSRDVTFRGLES